MKRIMNKPEIKLDAQKPSDEQVLQYKNFDAVLSNHAALSPPAKAVRPWKFWAGGIAVVAFVATLCVVLLSGEPIVSETPVVIADVPQTTPNTYLPAGPIADVEVPYEVFTVVPGRDTVIKTASADEIIVPANSLLDENEIPTTVDATLMYRKIGHPVDYFLSGMPPFYAQEGIEQHMNVQSAFELRAHSEMVPLAIAADKPIGVRYQLQKLRTSATVYRLDTTSLDWKFEKDVIYVSTPALQQPDISLEQLIAKRETLDNQLAQLKRNKPQLPEQAEADLPHLRIDVDAKEFPEIAAFENIHFEIGPENTGFSADLGSRDWDDVKIKKQEDKYLLTFIQSADKYEFTATPVLLAKDHAKAKAAFEKEYTAAIKSLEAKKQLLVDVLKELEETHQNNLVESTVSNSQLADSLKENDLAMQFKATTIDYIAVDDFGVWCSAAPYSPIVGKKAVLSFALNDAPQTFLDVERVYFVNKMDRAMYSMNSPQKNAYAIDTESDLLLWTVYNDELLYCLESDFMAFQKEAATTGKVAVILKKAPDGLNSPSEIKQFLGF